MKLDGLTSLIKEGGVVISSLSQRFPRPRVNHVKTE